MGYIGAVTETHPLSVGFRPESSVWANLRTRQIWRVLLSFLREMSIADLKLQLPEAVKNRKNNNNPNVGCPALSNLSRTEKYAGHMQDITFYSLLNISQIAFVGEADRFFR